MLITIITLFPEVFEDVLNTSILKRAQEKGKINIKILNLRDFGIGRHKQVDDRPYGGGAGMVLRVDVLSAAIKAAKTGNGKEAVILTEPKGELYSQKHAEKFSKFEHIIIVCGHYEGFDERIKDLIDYEISIGDFVLTGGEIPAMTIIDSVTRLIPGVLKKDDAPVLESFSEIDGNRILEHSHYTRPPIFEGKKVPEVLLSGNFKEIENYRKKEAGKITKKRRPELLKND